MNAKQKFGMYIFEPREKKKSNIQKKRQKVKYDKNKQNIKIVNRERYRNNSKQKRKTMNNVASTQPALNFKRVPARKRKLKQNSNSNKKPKT